MAGRIRIMTEALASKIAAGEVVERPASVVKELVENSIDARATDITVSLSEGGRRVIKVSDNGEGMGRSDAGMSVERHATSKISRAEDLLSVSTMGFRGEALWAISSVSKLTLRTKRREDGAGTLVRTEGGRLIEVADEGCPDGTSVEVRDLFYNTPARAKFLRTPGTEFNRVLDLLKKLALANPGIRFRLMHGSSRVVDAPAGDLRQRIGDLFGGELSKRLVMLDDPRIEGFLAHPDATFTTSRSLFTFINQRPVIDRGINRAVITGYGALLDDTRYPFAVINVKVDLPEVDVNVHPAKSEVRFKNPHAVYELVRSAVRRALGAGSVPRKVNLPHAGTDGRSRAFGIAGEASAAYLPDKRPGAALREPGGGSTLPLHGTHAAPERKGTLNPELLSLQVVGQIWGEFLVAEGEEDFFIIDQHGAAERCAFERLRREYKRGSSVKRQLLLLPEKVETTPGECEALKRVMPLLERLGFDVIPFGPSGRTGGETFMIKSVPEVLGSRRSAQLIKDLAEELADADVSSRVEERIEDALMRIACHSVIRGPRRLTVEEGMALLKELSGIDFAGHCPHGRPVMRRFSRRELEGMFKR